MNEEIEALVQYRLDEADECITSAQRPGTFGRELSSWLHETFHLRQEADYRPMFEISPDRAGAALKRAKAFLAAVKARIQGAAAESEGDIRGGAIG